MIERYSPAWWGIPRLNGLFPGQVLLNPSVAAWWVISRPGELFSGRAGCLFTCGWVCYSLARWVIPRSPGRFVCMHAAGGFLFCFCFAVAVAWLLFG